MSSFACVVADNRRPFWGAELLGESDSRTTTFKLAGKFVQCWRDKNMVRVGVAGIGFMGMIHYLSYQKVGNAKVAALCEMNEKRLTGDWTDIKGNFGPAGEMMDLSGIETYTDLDAMFANPEIDLVDICLPPAFHADAVVKALEAGKHVFCEKPMALDVESTQRMVAAAEATGKLLMIGHVLPLLPEYQFAVDAKRSGKYGNLLGGHFKRVISDPQWLPHFYDCLLYTSPSPRDATLSRMPSSA